MEYLTLQAVMNVLMAVTMIAGIFVYWRKGGNSASFEAIKTLREVADASKDQINQLKERVTTCEELHRENLSKVGKLEGMVQEKENRVSYLENLIKERNPESIKFMEYMSKIGNAMEKYIADYQSLPGILKEIKDFMQALNKKNH